MDAPPADASNSDDYDGDDGFRQELLPTLDLRATGVRTVVWACGYAHDFSWVRRPVFDSDGYPLQTRGVTTDPGLYFVGLRFLTRAKSDLFYGVGDDAASVAAAIAGRAPRRQRELNPAR